MPLSLHSASGLLAGALLVWVTGSSVLRLAGARFRDPALALGLAVGLGVALQPLAWLWLDTLGVPVTRGTLVGSASLLFVLSLLAERRQRRRRDRNRPVLGAELWPGRAQQTVFEVDERMGSRADGWALGALAVTFLAALGTRWWAARDLDLPRWGDSVHHTVIVALLVDHHGFPPDWRPYADLASFSYHFGFHALAAGIALIARMAPHEAVLVAGQALMAFGVLTAYALGATLGGRAWVGVGAALAAAGLSAMPGYYLNWGRYTQLAGQVILPVAAACIVLAAGRWLADPLRAHEAPPWSRLVVVATVAVAGLAMTHYIVVLFLVVFGVAWVVAGQHRLGGLRGRAGSVVTLGAVAVGAALLAAPWIPHFLEGPIGGYAVGLSTTAPPDPAVWGLGSMDAFWGQLDELAGWGLVAAGAAGGALAVVRRDRAGLVSVLWVALLVAATHPALLGLPVTGLLKPFTVAIGLYVFAGVAVGVLVAVVAGQGGEPRRARRVRRRATPAGVAAGRESAAAGPAPAPASASGPASAAAPPPAGSQETGARRSKTRPAAAALMVAAVAAAAAFLQRDVLIPQTRLVGPDDRSALAWVTAYVAPDAVFLVSAFPAFGDSVAAGDDAGWWLPYLTGRAATLPPISYSMERPLEPGYRERVNELVRLWHADLDAPTTLAALDLAGVSHAYVGQVARANDDAGGGQGLARRLAASPHWRLVHEDGGAQVWERLPDPGRSER